MKKKIIAVLLVALVVSVNYYTIAFAKNKVETSWGESPVTVGLYSIKHVLYVDYKRAAESFDLDELKKLAYGGDTDEGMVLKGTLSNVCFKTELVKSRELMEPNTYLINSIKKYKIVEKFDEDNSNIYRKEYVNGMLHSSSLVTSRSGGGYVTTDFINPTKTGVLTSGFGRRWGRSHNGIDIGLDYGDNIYAAKSGKVEFSGYKGGFGYSIKINHGGGLQTRYAHNSKLLVKEGAFVKQGQLIAKAGSTGRSTGVHLHFEILLNNKPLNPIGYVKY